MDVEYTVEYMQRKISRLTRETTALRKSLKRERTTHLTALAVEINEVNKANGWDVLKPDEWATSTTRVPTVLALIHSEVSEALEAFRKNDGENFREELADVLIRTLDAAGGLGLDMDAAVRAKIKKNRSRGYRHGGKRV